MTVSSSGSLSGTRDWQCGAPDELAMRFVDKLRGGGKLLRLSRRKDQQRIAIFALQRSKRDERKRLFGSNDAACYDDRRAAAARDLGFEPVRERRRRRQLGVVFQITTHSNAVIRRSKRANALRILFALHEESACVGERILQERTQKKAKRAQKLLIPRKRAIRNASTQKENGDFALASFPQKIRPYFRFQNENERWMDRLKSAPHAKTPI